MAATGDGFDKKSSSCTDETLNFEQEQETDEITSSDEECDSESHSSPDASGESCNFENPAETHKEFMDAIEAYRYLFEHFYDSDKARITTCVNKFDTILQCTNYDDELWMDVVKGVVERRDRELSLNRCGSVVATAVVVAPSEVCVALVPYRVPVWLEIRLLLIRHAFLRACACLVRSHLFRQIDEVERIPSQFPRFDAAQKRRASRTFRGRYFAFIEHLINSLTDYETRP